MSSPVNSCHQINIKDIHMVAGFALLNDETSQEAILQGNWHSKEEMKGDSYFIGRIIRVLNDVVIGDRLISTCIAEFNTECRGWHYGWAGSRFKTCISHVFTVHVFVPGIHSGYQRVGRFNSSPFMIASLRRKGGRRTELMDAISILASAQGNNDLIC
jgi:hypothetical protein